MTLTLGGIIAVTSIDVLPLVMGVVGQGDLGNSIVQFSSWLLLILLFAFGQAGVHLYAASQTSPE
jgi:hypothetical protein